jgi:4-hydroxy-4-methyl-2-oxoglutarate aldolase
VSQMITRTALSSSDFERIRELDTCTVSNAIERLNVRLRNEGFVSNAVRCQFPRLPPMLGYAVTGLIRTSAAPVAGNSYHDRIGFLHYVSSMPEPRVMVLQDGDRVPGVGALMGEIHATIAQALNCVGCVTNGAVRDLPAVEAMGFHLFAGGVAVSHAYAHVVEFGEPVEIGGLKIHSGDLVHGDRHGVHIIPLSVAPEIPRVAAELLREERELIAFCRSPQFSLQGLSQKLEHARDGATNTNYPGTKP